jgi:hypothetical protein
MRAIIKDIYSLDISDLNSYYPEDPKNFCFHLRLIIGPEEEEGEESFDIEVCTPKWLIENHNKDDIIIGRHYLIVFEYNIERIIQKVKSYCESSTYNSWKEASEKIGRLGKWEFEDYIDNDNRT